MRTESDLRTALKSLEQEAPTPATVLAALDHPPRPPRRVAIIAVATATAVAAAAVPTYRALTDNGSDAAQPSHTTWRFSYTVNLPEGWKPVSESVQRGGQVTTVIPTGSVGSTCSMTSYERGRFNEAALTNREPIELPDGRKAILADLASWQRSSGKLVPPSGATTPGGWVYPGPGSYEKRFRPVVAVEYAADSWRIADCAFVQVGRDQLVEQERQLAGAVSEERRAVRSPVSLGYLPAGWPVQDVQQPAAAGGEDYAFQFTAYATGYAPSGLGDSLVLPDSQPPEPTNAELTFRRVSVTVTKGDLPASARKGTPITVDGRRAWVSKDPRSRSTPPNTPVYNAWILVESSGYSISIESMSTDADYTPELTEIARSMRIADDPLSQTQSGWFDADAAFPR